MKKSNTKILTNQIKTKDDLANSIVIAKPDVIRHLEALGFINRDGIDYTDLAIWIGHSDYFSKLREAHTSDNYGNKYLTPDDVLSVPLPKPKKTNSNFRID